MAFCKVSNLCRPVIHLHIDVRGIFGIPGRVLACIRIPYSLQVGWLRTWLRRGNKKITPKLEVVSSKLRIGRFVKFLDAKFCILSLLYCIALESKVYSVKLILIYSFVVGQCRSIILPTCLVILQIGESCSVCITTHIIVLFEVCCLRYNDGSMGGSCDIQSGCIGCSTCRTLSIDCSQVVIDTTITIYHTNICTELQLVIHIFALVASWTHHCLDGTTVIQFVGNKFFDIRLVTTCIRYVEIEFSCLVGLKTYYRHIIFKRCEHRALISHILYMIFHMTRGCIHVQIAYIALCINRIFGLGSFHIVEALTWETNKHHTCRTVACSM